MYRPTQRCISASPATLGGGKLQYDPCPPRALPDFEKPFCGLLGHSDRIVVRPKHPGEGVHQHQGPSALRVGGGEHHGHWPTFGIPDQRDLLRAGSIQDNARVVHPVLQRRQGAHGDRVGEASLAYRNR
jgi:hypothetical protein